MSEIAQLIDELRDYSVGRKGYEGGLMERAADALEEAYGNADFERRALSARIIELIKTYQDDCIIENTVKKRDDYKRGIEVVDYITTCKTKEIEDAGSHKG